jgi:arylsulfatase A-like enzyme
LGSLSQSVPQAVRWLERNSKDGFFLFVHGADAHSPYACPQDWRGRFAASSSAVPVGGDNSDKFPLTFGLGLYPMADWIFASSADLDKAKAWRSDPRNIADLSDSYDGCLAFGDEQLAALSAALTRDGLWKDTVVIVTADHGEEFGEHGGYGHSGRPLHEEIVHVPLVIVDPRAPRSAGRRTGSPFEQIDLLPTIADLEGWTLPAGVEGRSQRAVLEGAATSERVQYAQACPCTMENGAPENEALRLGNWKAVRTGARWELFDLSKDPREQSDLFDARPDVFLDLAGKRLTLEAR